MKLLVLPPPPTFTPPPPLPLSANFRYWKGSPQFSALETRVAGTLVCGWVCFLHLLKVSRKNISLLYSKIGWRGKVINLMENLQNYTEEGENSQLRYKLYSRRGGGESIVNVLEFCLNLSALSDRQEPNCLCNNASHVFQAIPKPLALIGGGGRGVECSLGLKMMVIYSIIFTAVVSEHFYRPPKLIWIHCAHILSFSIAIDIQLLALTDSELGTCGLCFCC